MGRPGWKRCTVNDLCEACGSDHYCGYTDDGAVRCMKIQGIAPPGWRLIRQDAKGGTVIRKSDDPGPTPNAQLTEEQRAKKKRQQEEEDERRERARSRARGLWQQAKAGGDGLNHDRARDYFGSRGIPLERLPLRVLPPTLRFHPRCPREEDGPDGKPLRNQRGSVVIKQWPAVLGCVWNRDGLQTGLHRIFLDDNGPGKITHGKAKKALGSIGGAAVRLSGPDKRTGTLILVEGIETGLAVLAACTRPDGSTPTVWACISGEGLQGIELPSDGGWIRRIIIAGDFDAFKEKLGYRPGTQYARIAANTLALGNPSIPVGVAIPSNVTASKLIAADEAMAPGKDGEPRKGVDWLDVLVECGAEAVAAGTVGGVGVTWIGGGGAGGGAPPPSGGGGGGEESKTIPETRTDQSRCILNELFRPAHPGLEACWHVRRFARQWWVLISGSGGWRWVEEDEERVRAKVTAALDTYVRESRGDVEPWAPSREAVAGALEQVVLYAGVRGDTMPAWLPADFDAQGMPTWAPGFKWEDQVHEEPIPAGSVIALRNGLLDADAWTRGEVRLLPPTSRWFTRTCLPFALDVDRVRKAEKNDVTGVAEMLGALCPRWLNFLDETFTSNEAEIAALQQWFGYCLVTDARLQKILWLQGAPGSGKGTIREMLTGIIGDENVAMTTLHRLGGRFDLAGLVGRSVYFVPEVRVGHTTDIVAALDMVLSISGGDPQAVERKGRDVQSLVRLSGKFVFTPNEEPKLPDASAAIMRRLVVLRTRHVPAKPDPELQTKLREELEGIFLWALYGLRDLRRAGDFVQPEEGRDLIDDMRRGMSPVMSFVEDSCVVQPGSSVHTDTLFALWEKWREAEGYQQMAAETFGRKLRAAVPAVTKKQARSNGALKRLYLGIRPLLPGEDPKDPQEPCLVERSDLLDLGDRKPSDSPLYPHTWGKTSE